MYPNVAGEDANDQNLYHDERSKGDEEVRSCLSVVDGFHQLVLYDLVWDAEPRVG